jgi:glycosyltransferase involved in cell wall biosynthesis
MTMKNIIIDATGIGNTPTGLGKYSYYLLESLVKHRSCNFTILNKENLLRCHPLFQLKDEHVTFTSVDAPTIGPKREYAIFGIRDIINQHDLYHCLSSFLPAFGLRIPSLVTIHDLKYLLFPHFFGNYLKSLYYGWIIRKGVRRATYIIAVSHSTKKDIESLSVPSDKIQVMYEAPTILTNSKEELPEVVRGKKYLLFVGENRPHKNIRRMIMAYEIAKHKLKDHALYLVIAGSRFDPLMKKQRDDGIIFVGAVDDNTLISLYKDALALVYPSLYEGFGLPIIEAMKLGTPVITSNCSSMKEVAGNAAVLVNPYDSGQIACAMERLIVDKNERMKLRKMGSRRVKCFSWRKVAEEICGIYERLLS